MTNFVKEKKNVAKVEIKSTGMTAHIYIDGVEVPKVQSYSVSHSACELPEFTMSIPVTELVLDGDGFVPELPEVYKPFYVKRTIEITD